MGIGMGTGEDGPGTTDASDWFADKASMNQLCDSDAVLESDRLLTLLYLDM